MDILFALEELVENIRDSIGVRDRSIFKRTNSTTQNTAAKRDQFAIKVFPSPDDDPSKDLQKLHEILIEPIVKLLPTDPNERVIFILQIATLSMIFLVGEGTSSSHWLGARNVRLRQNNLRALCLHNVIYAKQKAIAPSTKLCDRLFTPNKRYF